MKLKFDPQNLLNNRNLNKWLGFALASMIVILTIWMSNSIVQNLKEEEQKKMETIVKATELLGSLDTSDDARRIALKIIEDNTSMPMILVDENKEAYEVRNLEKLENDLLTDSIFLKQKLSELEAIHDPIEVNLPFGKQYIYYQNSSLLTKLRYYPLALLIILLSFAAFTVWYFRTLERTQRSFLWAGMAKETAHQIGTPLSSLLGWIEILRLENVDPDTLSEIENDVQRLNQIAERFSKIGSRPTLHPHNIVEICENTYNYLKPRISTGINFQLRTKSSEIMVDCNPELLSWVLENLVRNAVDAMQNRGKIEIRASIKDNKAVITVTDDGSGIPSKLQKRIFEPGYTTKKRGWGLGLSLAKRIINEYHDGQIFVAQSDKEHGTQFKIILKTSI
ncbi:ATP-binding protein [Weeksellaceae bacterium KMM 9713]|uniref:histidine kinase n=1 Tax=Profundicola chukchiensis TaxID=2961959 RepID=A0A9X4RX41_9FLAO|nr:ATP-binding protein [Profundicola chukchiensis]MDG4945539.1 ATP-binding protein [Profundicola chukchiensis]